MDNYIYICHSDLRGIIKVYDSWDKASKFSGVKRKFEVHNISKMKHYIVYGIWGNVSNFTVEQWDAPSVFKEWNIYLKENETVFVYFEENKCDIYFYFKMNNTKFHIHKSPLFVDMNNICEYIMHRLRLIAKLLGICRLRIYTDLIELLKINKLNYIKGNDVDIYITIESTYKILTTIRRNWNEVE